MRAVSSLPCPSSASSHFSAQTRSFQSDPLFDPLLYSLISSASTNLASLAMALHPFLDASVRVSNLKDMNEVQDLSRSLTQSVMTSRRRAKKYVLHIEYNLRAFRVSLHAMSLKFSSAGDLQNIIGSEPGWGYEFYKDAVF